MALLKLRGGRRRAQAAHRAHPRGPPRLGGQDQRQAHGHRSGRLDGGGKDRLRCRPRGTQENHPGPVENQTGNPGIGKTWGQCLSK